MCSRYRQNRAVVSEARLLFVSGMSRRPFQATLNALVPRRCELKRHLAKAVHALDDKIMTIA